MRLNFNTLVILLAVLQSVYATAQLVENPNKPKIHWKDFNLNGKVKSTITYYKDYTSSTTDEWASETYLIFNLKGMSYCFKSY